MMENDTEHLIITYGNDLLIFADRLLHQSVNEPRIQAMINIVQQMACVQASLSDNSELDTVAAKKLLKKLQGKLYTLLTEKNGYTTWFTKIVDHYCDEDPELKQRLNDFVQHAIGPVVKLSEFVRGDKKSLAIEFPNQKMRDLFLHQSGINKENDLIVVTENRVYLPAFLSESQLLGVLFTTVKLKEHFIRLLNLDKTHLIVSDSTDCNLYFTDRRIHDTASKFHLAVLCPYFTEYYKIRYASYMIAQAYRDGNSFFSAAQLPIELAAAIASNVSSSDVISEDEKTQIAIANFRRPSA
ncbi:hypothetical protein [Fluoribacter gormanii]|uniref:hypothetical protein n=1 Tax=Fluoribacter gormanii TaxID=464 RepID=UPI0010413212|nr:hypothetical protein [Fluoribacter gormanii]